MKRLFLIFVIIAMLMVCACSEEKDMDIKDNNESLNSSDNNISLEIKKTETKKNTKSIRVVSVAPKQTPGEKTFDVSAEDITLQRTEVSLQRTEGFSLNHDPYRYSYVEITDADVKVEVYNMLKNALECEPLDYDKYQLPVYAGSQSPLNAVIQVSNGESYNIYLGSPEDSDKANFVVRGTYANDYLLDEKFINEFYKLLGIKQNTKSLSQN